MLVVLGWVLVSAQNASCRRDTGPKPVARIGGRTITAEDLDRQIARTPSRQREQPAAPAARKAALDQMIRFELLATEAERRGYASDPEILRAHKQQMIAGMVRKEAPPATDGDVEAYYRGHYAEFHRPDDFRARQIVVTNKKAAAQIAAAASAARTQDRVADQRAFGDLVVKHSEDQGTKGTMGDLGFVSLQSPNVPKPVLEAAAKMREEGEVSGPIEAGGRFAILKLVERRAGFSRAFAEVKEDIRRKLAREAEKKWLDDLAARLRATVKVQIHDPALR